MVEQRIHAIDLLKFFAAILITNSHMGDLYPGVYNQFATGGAIGDSLFFFCSGFLLMMGRGSDFFNWYKRRINRIFPTVFAVAMIGIVAFGTDPSLKYVILHGGGWFVQAILVFYAVFWFIKRFFSDKLWIAYVFDSLLVLTWFCFFWDKEISVFTYGTYLRWPCYFMIMLFGASVSRVGQRRASRRSGLLVPFFCLMVLILFFYGFQLLENRISFLKEIQIVLLPVLMGIVWFFYRISSSTGVLKLYSKRFVHWPVYYISACCLEIYLSGRWSFVVGQKLIAYFPLNIIVAFLCIFIVAYLVKVFSNFLSQTFKNEPYDWKGLVRL